jgi:GT2 family glycosyltransferase
MVPEVVVVLVNWNSWRDTIQCLESLKGTGYPNYRTLIVDNHSVDDSRERLGAYLRNNQDGWRSVQIVHNEENTGYAGGINAAVEHLFAREPSAPRFIFLLNNDARVQHSTLTKCVEISLAQDAAMVGAVVLSEDGKDVLFAGGRFPRALFINNKPLLMGGPGRRSWPVDWVDGAAMLVRADVVKSRLQQLGYFLDPDLFMYGEEIEVSWWARSQGHRLLMAGEAVVHHRVGGSGGLPLSLYYITRNRIVLARRLLPWGLQVAFHCWYPVSRLFRALQGCLEGRLSIARVILFGLFDGYRSVLGKWRFHPDKHLVGRS